MSVDWDGVIERQSEALTRILGALAAMAGLLDAAHCRLPRAVYCAVLGPLRAAEAAARRLSPRADEHDQVGVARLRLRFLVLCRTIDGLRRRRPRPAQDSARQPGLAVAEPRTASQCRARRAVDDPDTS